VRKQTIQLEVHDRILVSQRRRDGHPVGKPYSWRVQEKSNLPREIFHLIFGYIRRRVRLCDDKSFRTLSKAVRRGIHEAAKSCGCESESDAPGGGISWYLDGSPLIVFQIHSEEIDKQRKRKMLDGDALLRWAIVIGRNGFIKISPRRTRNEASTK
jgi:hypothetical protein